MSTLNNSRPMKAAAAWLCATFTIGCAAAPIRPLPGDCPRETVRSMEEMNLLGNGAYDVVIDINQPGEQGQEGTYRSGPVVGRVVPINNKSLPEGTLLYGQLWTEGLTKEGREAVLGRYTEALLPDGRRVPICFALGGDWTGLTAKSPGSKPGQTLLPRQWVAMAVTIWP